MKQTASCFFALCLFFLLSCCAFGESGLPVLEDVTEEKSGSFSCSFDGVRHRFVLDLPDQTENAPLVLMLPGYGNTAEAFRSSVHFEKAAKPLGYAVAWVTGAPDPNSPASSIGWHSDASTEGNRDVEFLVSLAAYLQDTYSLDPTRCFAVGFSNGGLMVHRLAVEAAGSFSACVSVAGLMPESVWEQRPEEIKIGFFQITGEKDDVVPKNSDGSARFSKAPAIEDVMAWWAAANGLDARESVLFEDGSVLTKNTGTDGPQQVWHLIISGGRHSWPDGQFRHPGANTLILDFFEALFPFAEKPGLSLS